MKLKIIKLIAGIVSAIFLWQNALTAGHPGGVPGYCDSLRPMAAGEKGTGPGLLREPSPNFDPKAPPFTQIVQRVFYDRGFIVETPSVDRGFRAIVYRARQISTGKIVAIKIANPFGDFNADICQFYCDSMTQRIAFWRANGIFNHNFSGLVQLYDAGQIPAEEMRKYLPDPVDPKLQERLNWDYHYQIMEFFDGKSVEERRREKFFKGKDVALLLSSLAKLANGIDAMHKKGLAHNELLIKNIMVSTDMEFKVCDLDPMKSLDAETRRKDLIYLRIAIDSILMQASFDTSCSGAVESFFQIWNEDHIAEKGLPDFAEALLRLREEILRSTGRERLPADAIDAQV